MSKSGVRILMAAALVGCLGWPALAGAQQAFSAAVRVGPGGGVLAIGEPVPPAWADGGSRAEKQHLLSQDGAQALVLDFCCGTSGRRVQRMTVRPALGLHSAGEVALQRTTAPVFELDTGLRLEIGGDAVVRQLGRPSAELTGAAARQALQEDAGDCLPGASGVDRWRVLVYRSEDMAGHALLRKHGMPVYVQTYALEDGRLICMAFGFGYP